MRIVTVCIPTIAGREALLERAVQSVQVQTVPCELLVMKDEERKGPGATRNRLLAQVKTPFLVFLDDDDYIDARYVEKTLIQANATRGYYVYTDWYEYPPSGPRRRAAPDCCQWFDGTWHTITALLPTRWARSVGGFNEKLPALEDTDFWLKIRAYGGCSVRLAEPLMHYTSSPDGRSHNAVRAGIVEKIKRELADKYRGITMPCCTGTVAQPPAGDRQPDDVLVTPVFGGRMRRIGRVTGRMYPYSGPGDYVWVSPRDVQVSNEWRLVNPPLAFSEAAEQLSDYLRTLGEKNVSGAIAEPPAPLPEAAKPNLARLKARKSGN